MSGCFLMLEQLLDSIETLDGIVCYSLQQLPSDGFKRKQVFRRIIEAGRSIHFAVEGLNVSDWASVRRVDEITQVQSLMPLCLSAEELRAAGGMID
jgi:sporadic carbohydrate cluster protein (TIGR04323 family)